MIEKVYLINDPAYKPILSRLAFLIFFINLLVTAWKRYQGMEILGNCCISKYYCTTKSYLSETVIAVQFQKDRYGEHIDQIGTVDSNGRFRVQFITSKNDENVSTLLNIIRNNESNFSIPPTVETPFNKRYILSANRKKYETKKILEYGQITETATLVGGMDELWGKYIPVFKITYNGNEYMTWGLERMNKEQLRNKMGKNLIVLFAPGKSIYVHEIDYSKSLRI